MVNVLEVEFPKKYDELFPTLQQLTLKLTQFTLTDAELILIPIIATVKVLIQDPSTSYPEIFSNPLILLTNVIFPFEEAKDKLINKFVILLLIEVEVRMFNYDAELTIIQLPDLEIMFIQFTMIDELDDTMKDPVFVT
ncbi:Hypothetical_protein [Hexamita inflata]|uniref:Hypothetical_protein n=1 Tax=Hexamita inflata TaxID=28002 RepID=A0AA86P0C4_9EUKA|nr:Hypothetical protein HINF_LOCUS15806 [Hexamita inflata]